LPRHRATGRRAPLDRHAPRPSAQARQPTIGLPHAASHPRRPAARVAPAFRPSPW